MGILTGTVRRPGAGTPTALVHITTVPETLDFLTGQIGDMKTRGYEVHAVSAAGPRLDAFATRAWIACHPIPMSRRVTPLRDLVALARLWWLLRRLRPAIVHAHTPKGGLLGMVAAWAARVPGRVYTLHGLPLATATGWRRRLLWWSDRIACSLAHRRFCVSRSLREAVAGEGIFPASRLDVLGGGSVGGVDARGRFDPSVVSDAARRAARERLAIPPEARVIAFVGRIVRDKGVVELLGAWDLLRARFPDLHLLIVGPMEPNDPIPPEVAERMRHDERVHLTGWSDDPAPLYAAADVLALPTYREGLSQTLLEAAAMPLPVVASRVVGCVDPVQDGVTGTLVPVGDVPALADALRAYLDAPGLGRAHGEAGRRRVLRDFEPEALWQATAAAYAGLLAGRASPAPFPAPAASPWTRGAKRCMDIALAAVGLIVLTPLMAAVALAIAAAMGRPVFFRQVRPGLGGKPFVLVKFRSMREAHGPDGAPLPDADRLTRLGAFLRRTSLDELPQLWNVLKGEMSLVGPRPLLPEYMPHYSDRQRLRHEVRPGITGLAQTHGRNRLAWDERLEMDVRYVERVSLRLDLRILARTALNVLRGSGVCLDSVRFDEFTLRRGADIGGNT